MDFKGIPPKGNKVPLYHLLPLEHTLGLWKKAKMGIVEIALN